MSSFLLLLLLFFLLFFFKDERFGYFFVRFPVSKATRLVLEKKSNIRGRNISRKEK